MRTASRKTDQVAPLGPSSRRSRRRHLIVLVALALVASACHRLPILDSPSLVAEGHFVTRPFPGTSTKMFDGEGSAYVPANNRLWLTEDNGDALHQINPDTGSLVSTIDNTALAAATRYGGGPAAGSDRSLDLDALAYDEVEDDLYVVSNGCCSPSSEPTIFRLTRPSRFSSFTVESWQSLPQSFAGAAATPTGDLHLSTGGGLVEYDYESNTFGATIALPGVPASISSVAFSGHGADLFLTASNKVYRVDWASTTIVPGYIFDLSTHGISEGRSVEQIGSLLFVQDGDDSLSSGDPLKYALHRFSVDGINPSPIKPVASVAVAPTTGLAPLTVSFDASASSDPDGDIIGHHWWYGDGGLDATAGPTTDHEYLDPGVYTSFQLVEDDGNNIGVNSQTITVKETNVAPVLDPVGDQDAFVGEELTFTATATDSNVPIDILFFSLVGAPAGASMSIQGDFTWTPTAGQLGEHTFDVRVSDTGIPSIDDTETITVTVDEISDGQAQTSFRIRSDDTVALNSDTGWAAPQDDDATLAILDTEFRIRFRISGLATTNDAYELWYRKDGGQWAPVATNDDPWAASPETSLQREVQVVPSSEFSDGAATTERLGGTATFTAGEGRESAPTGLIGLASDEETEIEFNLLIRKWSEDGHVEDGTDFEFRVRIDDGSPLASYAETPEVTIANRRGHIGGSFVETPATTMVADDDGNLYAAIEATDQTGGPYEAELVVVKSADGGDTWTAPDLGGRPGLMDIEALDMQYVAADDTIHIAYQGPSGDHVYYVPFATAGHPTAPDSYGTNELITDSADATDGQAVAVRKRSTDGVVYVAFNDGDGSDARVTIMRRDPTWGDAVELDGGPGDITGALMEIDSAGVIHVLYAELESGTTDGDLYHRSISTSDVLSARTQVNDPGTTLDSVSPSARRPHVPPVIYDDGGTERIAVLFADSADDLYFTQSATATISFSTDEIVSEAPISMGTGGSSSAVAALAIDDADDQPVALWVDVGDTRELRTDVRVGGSWGTGIVERVGDDQTGWVRAFAFQHSAANGSDRVIGIMLDDHPDSGGTGGIAYHEIVR